MRTVLAIFLVCGTAGCALLGRGGPPSPVGEYRIATEVNGQPIEVSVTIRENEDGSYGGIIVTPMLPTLQIAEIRWDGGTWYIRAPAPEAPVEILMTIDGDEISGGWSYGIDLGEFTGTRVAR